MACELAWSLALGLVLLKAMEMDPVSWGTASEHNHRYLIHVE